jgi:hypothetical protein
VHRPGDAPVRLHASLVQLAGLGVFVLVATVLFTVWFGPVWGGLAHVLGLLALIREGTGVELSHSGVRFWGFARRRSLTWAQVRDIQTAGSRIQVSTRTSVYVLGAPRRGHVLDDAAFDMKYALLRQTWEDRRAGRSTRTEMTTGV